MRRFLLWLVMLPACMPIQSQTGCDPALINAMKTKYEWSAKQDDAANLRHVACDESSRKTGIELFDIGGLTRNDVEKHCNDNSDQFFVHHQSEIALSFLPEPAFDAIKQACTIKGLVVFAKYSQAHIELAVSFDDGSGRKVKSDVTMLGVSKADCIGPLSKAGAEIGLPKTRLTCKRPIRNEVVFVLSAHDEANRLPLGSVTASVPALNYPAYTFDINGVTHSVVDCGLDGDAVGSAGPPPPSEHLNMPLRVSRAGEHKLTCSSQNPSATQTASVTVKRDMATLVGPADVGNGLTLKFSVSSLDIPPDDGSTTATRPSKHK